MNQQQDNQVAAIEQHKLNLFFEDQPVRIVIDDDGAPWWVARDVCDVLEIGNITEALRSLDDDELTSVELKSGGQTREMKIVNEPGLYSLIGKSRKPQAKSFKRWVNHEVLPSIRKTGTYTAPGAERSHPAIDVEAVRSLVGAVADITRIMARLESGEVSKMIERSFAKQAGKITYDTTYLRVFVTCNCEKDEAALVRKTDLYSRYRSWCAECRYAPYGYNSFVQALQQAFPQLSSGKVRVPGSRHQSPVFYGIGLQAVEEGGEEVQA